MHTLKQNAIEVQKPVPRFNYDEKQGQTQNKAQKSFESNIVLTLKESNSECLW